MSDPDDQPRNVKDLLAEAKDASELMVDLAYAAVFFNDEIFRTKSSYGFALLIRNYHVHHHHVCAHSYSRRRNLGGRRGWSLKPPNRRSCQHK